MHATEINDLRKGEWSTTDMVVVIGEKTKITG